MSEQDATRLANELLDAFNEGDFSRLRAVLATNVVYEETGTGRRIEGADAYVQLCEGWRHAFPDARGAVRASLANADTVAQDLLWTATHTGPLEGPGGTLPATGRRIDVPASLWVTSRGGKVQNVRHHLDVLSMLQQLGAMPAPA